jgi:aspartate/tyrosine/aromatic aminotransferase
MAPRDPILGLTEVYNADKRPEKVNLGVGVYYDDNGKVPLLECVRRAEKELADRAAPRAYLPIDGIAAYDRAVQTLVFGADNVAVKEGRVVTVQALGGTGGLKVGADFIRRISPNAQVWISDPSWENHRSLFEAAGFKVNAYPYYDEATRGVNIAGMLASLNSMPEGSVVVLHACCHNPTGVDLSPEQWTRVLEIVKTRGLVPFLDIAYQGFGDGIEADAAVVRQFSTSGIDFLVSSSFSKSFSLYGERVGALSVVAQDILARLRGEAAEPFRWLDLGSMAVIGPWYAVADLRGLQLTGLAGWVVWALAHLAFIPDTENRIALFSKWMWQIATRQRTALLITGRPDQHLGVDVGLFRAPRPLEPVAVRPEAAVGRAGGAPKT